MLEQGGLTLNPAENASRAASVARGKCAAPGVSPINPLWPKFLYTLSHPWPTRMARKRGREKERESERGKAGEGEER